MTYEEIVIYLLETYPADRYSDEELRGYIIVELESAETRGGITAEVQDKVYRHFGVTTQGYGGPG